MADTSDYAIARVVDQNGIDVTSVVTFYLGESNTNGPKVSSLNPGISSLYAKYKNLLALGMGENGRITRVASLLMGAPFSYVSSGTAKETAPGQITREQMKNVLEGLAREDLIN